MSSQRLLINTYTQKVSGTDTSLIVDFRKQYTAKRMVLNQFICTNIFSNFSYGNATDETDFSYGNSTQSFPLSIKQIHLDLDQFIQYFNSVQNDVQLTYQDNYSILTLTGDNQWFPIGLGWKKLGFSSSQLNDFDNLSITQQAMTYYQMTQTEVIYIRLDGLENSYQAFDGAATFQIPNLSVFGSRLLYNNVETDSNQQITFNYLKNFSQIGITLLDSKKNVIHTSNNDNANLQFFIDVTLYQT